MFTFTLCSLLSLTREHHMGVFTVNHNYSLSPHVLAVLLCILHSLEVASCSLRMWVGSHHSGWSSLCRWDLQEWRKFLEKLELKKYFLKLIKINLQICNAYVNPVDLSLPPHLHPGFYTFLSVPELKILEKGIKLRNKSTQDCIRCTFSTDLNYFSDLIERRTCERMARIKLSMTSVNERL